DRIGAFRMGITLTYKGRDKVDDEECDVVVVTAPAPQSGTLSYYFGVKDHLSRRVVSSGRGADARLQTTTFQLKHLQPGVTLEPSAFEWPPPPTAQLAAPNPPGSPADPAALGARLIPIGRGVPDFDLPVSGGGRLRLAEALKGKKAL